MSKYFDGELLSAYEDLNKEFECKKENVKLHDKIANLEAKLAEKDKEIESLKENWNVLCDYLGECIVKYDEIDTNGIYSEVIEKVNKLKKYDTSIAKTQNQKAIELLQELLQKTQPLNLMVKSDHYVNEKQVKVVLEDIIMQKISELKGKVEDD